MREQRVGVESGNKERKQRAGAARAGAESESREREQVSLLMSACVGTHLRRLLTTLAHRLDYAVAP